jgi:hypothetical protein
LNSGLHAYKVGNLKVGALPLEPHLQSMTAFRKGGLALLKVSNTWGPEEGDAQGPISPWHPKATYPCARPLPFEGWGRSPQPCRAESLEGSPTSAPA